MVTPEQFKKSYNPLYHYITFSAIVASFAFQILAQGVYLVLLLFVAVLSKKRRRIFRGFLKFVFPLILIGYIINGLFFSGTPAFVIGHLVFKKEGLIFATRVGLRLTILVTSIAYYFASVDNDTISEYLLGKGADRRFVYVYLLSVAMVQLLRDKLKRIYIAQSARGLDTTRNIFVRIKYLFPLLIPLSLTYLAESLDRGIALQAAGFMADRKRTAKPSSISEIVINDRGRKIGIILLFITLAIAFAQLFI
ncbi:MAG: energy-coupling factor transporter transmembrane component T family protein [Candidatus Kryptoniota bacterium]